MKKVFLSIGNDELENVFEGIDEIDIIDKESNLKLALDILEHVDIDILILNSFLDDTGKMLSSLAKLAIRRQFKVIILIPEVKEFDEKRLIAALVGKGVYSFIHINDVTADKMLDVINNYPKEFNFNLLGEERIKVVEKEKIVEKHIVKSTVIRNKVITFYSPDDEFLSAEATVAFADMCCSAGQSTIILDFNNINPMMDHLYNIDKTLPINDKYEVDSKTSLVALVNAINRQRFTDEIFTQLVIKIKSKLDIVTGLYDLILDDKIHKDQYEKIVNMAAKHYDVVIINTNPYLKSSSTFAALTNSTQVVAILRDNYTSLRNFSNQFNLLKKRIRKERISIVIRKGVFGIKKEILHDILEDYKFAGYMPNTDFIDKAINEQKSFMDVAPEDVKVAYRNLANELHFNFNNKSNKRRWWKRG